MEDINDLPVENLAHIFDFLTVDERKIVSRVCTLWYQVLHSAHFQRQLQVVLHSTFTDPPTEQEKDALLCCRHLSVNQWDDSCDYWEDYDDDDEEENSEQQKEPVIELKYLFEPTPEHNVTDLIFSNELKLESLELCSSYDKCRFILEDRLAELHHLNELALAFQEGRKTGQPPDLSVWTLRHDHLRSLKLNQDVDVNNFRVVAPNLTCLEVRPSNVWYMQIVKTYSSQLQNLTIYIEDMASASDLLELQFPSLTALRIGKYDDKEEQIRYALRRNRFADAEVDERFVRSLQNLKELRLASNLMYFRLSTALAKIGHKRLQSLTLDDQSIDYAQLKKLEALPNLKSIVIHRCDIVMTPQRIHPTVYLPRLEHLTLMYNDSSIVFNSGLAGLKSLTISIWKNKNQKILHKICNNFPNLEKLSLVLSHQLENTAFRHLNRLTKLHTLQLESAEFKEALWAHCPVLPGLRRILFSQGTMRVGTVQAFARLFPGLRELTVEKCFYEYNCDNARDGEEGEEEDEIDEEVESDDCDERKNRFQGKCARYLRKRFPLCTISLRHLYRWRKN